MIKRPLNPRFTQAVLDGIKTTTIRDKFWPSDVPIMLYNWSGAAYRSKHIDVAAVVVQGVSAIHITHGSSGLMAYSYMRSALNGRQLHETEGFDSQADMDEWFRRKIKLGQTVTKVLMRFHLHSV